LTDTEQPASLLPQEATFGRSREQPLAQSFPEPAENAYAPRFYVQTR
jgi:hypothetical protein